MSVLCSLVPSPDHRLSGHPESPDRFDSLAALPGRLPAGLTWADPVPASLADLSAVHSPELLEFLQLASPRGPAIIDSAPTYVTPASWDSACLAAGSALTCARAVWSGQAQRAFSLARPPGHHAERRRAMGFCLLNNIAVAAAGILDAGAQRVMVVDIDAHHGNGTQEIFLQEERVAFFSLHQWAPGFYPGTGALVDAPHARGRIVNLPLPPGAGDVGYTRALAELIRPQALRFQPELLLVSAGFDAHWSDPLTRLGLTTRGYASLTRGLLDLAAEVCAGRIVFVLEGGYDPAWLARQVETTLRVFSGETPDLPAETPPYPEPDLGTLITQVRALHGEFKKS